MTNDEETAARCAWVNLLSTYDQATALAALQMILDLMDLYNQTDIGDALAACYARLEAL